jgi:hypothetical protein
VIDCNRTVNYNEMRLKAEQDKSIDGLLPWMPFPVKIEEVDFMRKDALLIMGLGYCTLVENIVQNTDDQVPIK